MLNIKRSSLLLLYLPGFNSSPRGLKSTLIESVCHRTTSNELNIHFREVEYQNRQKDNRAEYLKLVAENKEGTISSWIQDAISTIRLFNNSGVIIIGSSMGAWIGLNVMFKCPDEVIGFVGIGSALDFTRKFMNCEYERNENHIEYLSNFSKDSYIISDRFVKDSEQYFLLNDLNRLKGIKQCPIRFIHGMKDDVVPWQSSTNLAETIDNQNTQVILSKNGDHRMSTSEDLSLLRSVLSSLIASLHL